MWRIRTRYWHKKLSSMHKGCCHCSTRMSASPKRTTHCICNWSSVRKPSIKLSSAGSQHCARRRLRQQTCSSSTRRRMLAWRNSRMKCSRWSKSLTKCLISSTCPAKTRLLVVCLATASLIMLFEELSNRSRWTEVSILTRVATQKTTQKMSPKIIEACHLRVTYATRSGLLSFAKLMNGLMRCECGVRTLQKPTKSWRRNWNCQTSRSRSATSKSYA